MGEKDDVCEVVFVNEEAVKAVKSSLPENDVISKTTNYFKVLGDPTRVKILCALSKKELCVCDLAALFEMTHSAISHQLRVLRDINFVKFRKEGKIVYYSLADEHVVKLIDMGIEHARE